MNVTLTDKMIEATRGFCWTSETEAERVQRMWDAMLQACDAVSLREKNSVFKLGVKIGREDIQRGLIELLEIKECFCDEDH